MQTKTCPRCGISFLCNHQDIAHCQCASVQLSANARQYIQTHYTTCLCCKCLHELNRICQ
ncbi:MAG: cysteine-rich CWC family protein [Paludibacter sp.]|nr:cysteine-rich CWC family protein [Bacteroidales bacterium]MCM1068475.1 cysteine-rich CWC family protein [Prevotella sp.]MCM1353429.1 cysteine-rich CWC family protein [Bacteroides sp.]MCM1442590.1 cysteine-rich CWC family protein [Muribaculum sp.]MCM1481435.1 cysteine-rich CWC family protein [Paludibacter sp.]